MSRTLIPRSRTCLTTAIESSSAGRAVFGPMPQSLPISRAPNPTNVTSAPPHRFMTRFSRPRADATGCGVQHGCRSPVVVSRCCMSFASRGSAMLAAGGEGSARNGTAAREVPSYSAVAQLSGIYCYFSSRSCHGTKPAAPQKSIVSCKIKILQGVPFYHSNDIRLCPRLATNLATTVYCYPNIQVRFSGATKLSYS